MSGRTRVGFEARVLVFLMLLVLLVVVLGVSNLVMSRSARGEAERAEIEAIRRVADEALLGLGEADLARALESPPVVPGRFPSSRLQAWASRYGLEGAAVLDAAGNILAGTPPLRAGSRHPAMPALDAGDRRSLARGREVVEPRGGPGPRWAFHPVRGGDGVIGLVATAHRSASSPRAERNYRVFAWAQGLALLAAVVLSLVFLRFILRPYRLLASAAAPAGEELPLPPDPGDLVAHFEGVLAKLRAQEEELRRLQAGPPADERIALGMSSAVVGLDEQGRIRTANEAAEAILGIRSGSVRGRPLGDALAMVDGLDALVRRCLESGRGRSREVLTFRRPDRSEGHLGASVSPIVGDGGRLEGAFCLLTDLTEIQSLQEQVRLKENLASLGELSAGVAHEFRNALGTILGLARLVERRPGDEDGVRTAARDIAREVHQVRETVDAFLAYARPARLTVAPVAVRRLLEDVAEGVRRETDPGPPPRIELEGVFPEIEGDETLLRQAFLNVLRNARESAEGPVRIRVRGTRRAGQLELLFADDGPGFSEESLATAFVPFATGKPQGTGLGLPIVQKTIVQHDGEVSVSNAPEGGGQVWIRLPLGEESRPAPARAAGGARREG